MASEEENLPPIEAPSGEEEYGKAKDTKRKNWAKDHELGKAKKGDKEERVRIEGVKKVKERKKKRKKELRNKVVTEENEQEEIPEEAEEECRLETAGTTEEELNRINSELGNITEAIERENNGKLTFLKTFKRNDFTKGDLGGCRTVLPREIEELVKHIIDMETRFFGFTNKDLKNLVYQTAERSKLNKFNFLG